jgi:hypothetical protein
MMKNELSFPSQGANNQAYDNPNVEDLCFPSHCHGDGMAALLARNYSEF